VGDHAGAKTEFKRLEAVAVSMRLKSGAMVGGLHRALMTIATRGPRAFKPGEHDAFYREQLQMLQGIASLRATLGRLALKFDKLELARSVLDELSANDFASVPKDYCYLYTLCNLAAIAIALGERPRAERLFALLEPYCTLNTPNTFGFYEGPVAHFLALLAAFLGREEPAEHYFRQALEITERLELRPLLARTCLEYAHWLTKSRRGSQAAPLQARALEISEQLGMHWLAEQARSLASREPPVFSTKHSPR
jgi:tetratricopeptide (TPR) repeat protein